MEKTALVAIEEKELDKVAGGRWRGRQRNDVTVDIGNRNDFDARDGGLIIIGVGGNVSL